MENEGIDIEPLGDGVAIHLPFRELGGVRKLGWLALLFGTVGSLFMLAWIGTPASWGIDLVMKGQNFGFLIIAFASIGLIGLYQTARIFFFGLTVVRDRSCCTVTVNEAGIVSREHFGWFGYNTKLKPDEVKQLYLAPLSEFDSEEGGRQFLDMMENYVGGINEMPYGINCKKRRGRPIAPFYPREVLKPVVAAIAAELNRNRPNPVVVVVDEESRKKAIGSAAEFVESESETESNEPELTLPENSKVEIINEADSTVFRIGERTAWKGSRGLFLFSMFWNAIIFGVTVTWLNARGNGPDWSMIVFFSAFWAVGIGTLVGAIYMARQSALIGIRDGLLFIERKTIFGTKWIEFTAEEIESIEMAHTNMEVNGRPVMNLQIEPKEGKTVGMFAQLENGELEWLAEQLRHGLGVKSIDDRVAVSKVNPADPVAPPKATDIVIDQRGERTVINVPPWHFDGSRGFQLAAMAFMLIPLPAVLVAVLGFGAEWMLLVFATIATLLGTLMFLFHRFITTRRFEIDVGGESLKVHVSGFLFQRYFLLSKDEVVEVGVFDSETKVNGKTLFCLRAVGTNGRSISMMTGRKMEELSWVASTIHKKLELGGGS